jgi:hypothetical protein
MLTLHYFINTLTKNKYLYERKLRKQNRNNIRYQ